MRFLHLDIYSSKYFLYNSSYITHKVSYSKIPNEISRDNARNSDYIYTIGLNIFI